MQKARLNTHVDTGTDTDTQLDTGTDTDTQSLLISSSFCLQLRTTGLSASEAEKAMQQELKNLKVNDWLLSSADIVIGGYCQRNLTGSFLGGVNVISQLQMKKGRNE